ncbi:MAG: hypothetical protein IPG33_05970 [Betaproteobacteria bacterium]|nr:hypothetical protein [Betaproteobacteria bacterium]
MPITPFHFGPGALIKAAAPRHVSWTTFALANGLIDLEPILLFFLTGEPAHRFFHTLPGATLAALAAAWPGRIAGEAWLRFWNRQLSPAQAGWLGCPATISSKQAFIGALLGAWSHLALDMAMHVDVTPLARPRNQSLARLDVGGWPACAVRRKRPGGACGLERDESCQAKVRTGSAGKVSPCDTAMHQDRARTFDQERTDTTRSVCP